MVFVYIFSIVIFYRYIKYFLNSNVSGKFLFNAGFDPRKKLLCFITAALYALYIALFYLLKFNAIGLSYADMLLPLTWVLLCFLPDKIYENGLKTSFEFISWKDICSQNKLKENLLVLNITKNGNPKKKQLRLKSTKDCDYLIEHFLSE